MNIRDVERWKVPLFEREKLAVSFTVFMLC